MSYCRQSQGQKPEYPVKRKPCDQSWLNNVLCLTINNKKKDWKSHSVQLGVCITCELTNQRIESLGVIFDRGVLSTTTLLATRFPRAFPFGKMYSARLRCTRSLLSWYLYLKNMHYYIKTRYHSSSQETNISDYGPLAAR